MIFWWSVGINVDLMMIHVSLIAYSGARLLGVVGMPLSGIYIVNTISHLSIWLRCSIGNKCFDVSKTEGECRPRHLFTGTRAVYLLLSG